MRHKQTRLAGPGVRETFAGPSPKEPLPELQTALRALLGILDTTWVVLAMVNMYLSLVAAEGLATARRWTGLILGAAFALAAVSVWTRWPLGPIYFTERLGVKLGPVPLGVPLLWFVVIIGARELTLWLAPRASHRRVAIWTGVLTALTDLALEPVAWKVRVFWWYAGPGHVPAGPPPWTCAVWLVAGAALAFFLRETEVVRSVAPRPGRPAAIFVIFYFVLYWAQSVRMIGG